MLVYRYLAVAGCCLLPAVGYAADRFAGIRPAVEASISHGELPGAVVAVLQNGETVYRKAFGRRAVKPTPSR